MDLTMILAYLRDLLWFGHHPEPAIDSRIEDAARRLSDLRLAVMKATAELDDLMRQKAQEGRQ